MLIEWLQEVGSTSTYLRENRADAPHATVVAARCQTAGRGQRGNSWEAEPGRNLTFSMLLRPRGVDARTQYAVSEAVATAIVTVLRRYVPDPDRLTIKWPNDIYYADSKLCGILIECSLSGLTIDRAVAGVGINVNQTEFRSDAPNPVSLRQITGREYPLEPLLAEVAIAIENSVDALAGGRDATHTLYLSMLWRRKGLHPYRLPDGERFMASIVSVAPTGHITLRHADGSESTHAFKEVIALI